MANVDFDGKPKKVNCFQGGIRPKYGLMAFEKKKLTLYQGIPGKKQKSTVFKYADMEGVYPCNIMAFSPTGFIIVMRDGSYHKFSATGRNALIEWLNERIEACQPKGRRQTNQAEELPEPEEEEESD